MNYGLPYKGSKSKIAEKIVGLFPQRKHLYDLFCGGGAITHYALTTHRFDDVFMNDVNWMCPTLFKNCLEGKHENEDRWISREEFERLKHTDPYVAFVWSFGNNLRDYIYGREIEPFKKALHWVLYYRDNSLIKEIGYDLSQICAIDDIQERYFGIKRYFRALEITPRNGCVESENSNTMSGQAVCEKLPPPICEPRVQTFERQTQTYNITQTSGVASGAFYKGKTFFSSFGQSPYFSRRLSRCRDFARLSNILRHSL